MKIEDIVDRIRKYHPGRVNECDTVFVHPITRTKIFAEAHEWFHPSLKTIKESDMRIMGLQVLSSEDLEEGEIKLGLKWNS